ncbi:MAG: sugar phosphate isomerase/epimerase family protein [Alphaproteobacteria bacterium]
MTITIGTCPCSWGVWYPKDDKQPDWQDYIKELTLAKYHTTELGPYGYLPKDPKALQKLLNDNNLKVCSTAAVASLSQKDCLDNILAELKNVGPLLKELGASWYVLMDESADYPNVKARSIDNARWNYMIEVINKVAQLVKEEYGLNFAFHPHVGTCVETQEQILRFMKDTNPKLVHLCFDIGHHAYTGADPIAFIKEHHSRIGYYHLKNVDAAIRQKVKDENLTDDEAFEMGVMCKLRDGSVDYKEIIKVIHATGFSGYCIIEQDLYPAPKGIALPIAIDNLKFIEELGL